MKLKFAIHYNTAWGESLHVVIAYHSQDGTVRHQNLLMHRLRMVKDWYCEKSGT